MLVMFLIPLVVMESGTARGSDAANSDRRGRVRQPRPARALVPGRLRPSGKRSREPAPPRRHGKGKQGEPTVRDRRGDRPVVPQGNAPSARHCAGTLVGLEPTGIESPGYPWPGAHGRGQFCGARPSDTTLTCPNRQGNWKVFVVTITGRGPQRGALHLLPPLSATAWMSGTACASYTLLIM